MASGAAGASGPHHVGQAVAVSRWAAAYRFYDRISAIRLFGWGAPGRWLLNAPLLNYSPIHPVLWPNLMLIAVAGCRLSCSRHRADDAFTDSSRATPAVAGVQAGCQDVRVRGCSATLMVSCLSTHRRPAIICWQALSFYCVGARG